MRPARMLSLILVGVMAGVLITGSAGAHLGGFKHLVKHMKKLFYTEAEADALLAGFLPRGQIRLTQGGPWNADQASVAITAFDLVTLDPPGSAPGDFTAVLGLTSPMTVGGVSHALTEIEICFRGGDSSADAIIGTRVWDTKTTTTLVLEHTTDHSSTSLSCYTVAPASPARPVGSLYLTLNFEFDNGTADDLEIGNVTTTWMPA